MKQMGFPKPTVIPDPQVYRLAAELVASGQEYYSCIAIRTAYRLLNPGTEETDFSCASMFMCQYEALFGPDYCSKISWDPKPINSQAKFGTWFVISDFDREGHLSHPFWSKLHSKRSRVGRRRLRKVIGYKVQALLFMAEIVESS